MAWGVVEDRPYFWNLSDEEQSILNQLRGALAHHKGTIIFPKTASIARLQKLANQILENDPIQIGVKGFRVITSPLGTKIQPIYTLSLCEVQILVSKCALQRAKILSQVNSTERYNDVLQIHDILSRNIIYVAGENPELHSIVGPLTKKIGVCEGYAKTLKYILDGLSIPSAIIVGTGYNQLMNREEPHAWNLVQIAGEWTHIDLTFDTTLREHGVPRYDYFGLSNEDMLKDHKFDVSLYPEAKSKKLSYYERNGLVMRKKSNLNAFLTMSLRAGRNEIVFKLPDTASEKDVEKQVASEINSFLSRHNLYMEYMLYYNTRQKVFHVHLDR